MSGKWTILARVKAPGGTNTMSPIPERPEEMWKSLLRLGAYVQELIADGYTVTYAAIQPEPNDVEL